MGRAGRWRRSPRRRVYRIVRLWGPSRGADPVRWLALLLLAVLAPACLRTPRVTYGDPVPVPIVSPANDPGRWYIPVETPRGVELLFLDTGYSVTTCDDGLAEALGLVPHGKIKIKGEVGSLPAGRALLPPLFLGGHRLEGLECVVRDLHTTSSLQDPPDIPIAGVLGIDALRPFRVTFDPRGRPAMTLVDPREAPAWRRGDPGVVRVRREGVVRNRAILRVAFDEVFSDMIVDTGASGTYADAGRMGLQFAWEHKNATIRGTGVKGHERRTIRYFKARVGLADASFPEVTVAERLRPQGTAGLLGLNVLGQFVQHYDFRRGLGLFEVVLPDPVPPWLQVRDEWPIDRVPVRLPADPGR